jgi:hypothetical protein
MSTSDDDVVTDAPFALRRRPLSHHAAARDDAGPVRPFVCFFQMLGGEEDDHVELVVQPAHFTSSLHAHPAHGVQACRGLVQEQHVRVVNQGGCQIEPALHASRLGGNRPIEGLADVDQLAEGDQTVGDINL